MIRPASSGRATAGLPTRLVLCALMGLLSLLVVGLPVEGAFLGDGAGPRSHFALEQRPDTDPVASPRIDRAMIDLDETGGQGRILGATAASVPDGLAKLQRPAADLQVGGPAPGLPERPPRA